MGAFDIGGVFAQQGSDLRRISVDHLDGNAGEPIPRAMLDDLDVLPVGLWLFSCRWFSSSLVLWYLTLCFNHRFSIAAFPVCSHRWRMVRMPAILQLYHQLVGNLALILSDRSSDT